MKPLLILTGPTGVGKTKLSLDLAKALGGEIISADSMQVYKGMNIGSAKIMPDEMEGVPHHLIDILEPDEAFDVAKFQILAKEAMAGIYKRGHIPIVTGGTGFYIQALLYDIDFGAEEDDKTYRSHLAKLLEDKGAAYLHCKLAKVDPAAAGQIHPNNGKRVIRALEYFHKTGQPISAANALQREQESPYNFLYFVLTQKRQDLYQRIEDRIDQMVDQGLVEEVKALRDLGYHKGMVSMQGLGYKELLSYLDGDTSLEEALAIVKRDTRRFAKRQLTWFRRERDVIWFDKDCYAGNLDQMLIDMVSMCKEKGICASS